MQDFSDKFVAPRPIHEIDYLSLTLYPNVALEADEDGPVVCVDRVSYRFANVKEWHAPTQCVSMGDGRSFGRWPYIDLDTSRAMREDMSVSGCGGMPKQLSGHEICVV